MKLNIYKISHPIIKTMLSKIDQTNQQYYYKYIGLLFIYEILRKHIDVKRIYIKQINETKYLDIINKNNKHFILTDLSCTYDMISDIRTMLPSINIVNINYQNIDHTKESINDLNVNLSQDKIIILEKVTRNDKIINLINYLNNKKNIDTANINVSSIISCEKILNKIGSQYPKLKVYTTKIL
uniref:Uracil phosphoribosyltransferase n=1 Tax=Polysiphonia sp. TaxID=1967842 RepID=A0A1Z1MTZ9_9FLOR|nr:uracil phosphoribosyltransferase [Polysiphonia sp.]